MRAVSKQRDGHPDTRSNERPNDRARSPRGPVLEPEARVEGIARPVLAGLGLDLVQVQVSGGGGGSQQMLQVMVERPDGSLNLDDCAAASRALSAALDVADPLPGAYVLEVGSPGIDRPLVRRRDFEGWSGHEARIELAEGLAAPSRTLSGDEAQIALIGRKRFRGQLMGVEDHAGGAWLRLETEAGEVLLPLGGVRRAKLELTDALLEAGRAAPGRAVLDEAGAESTG